MPPYWTEEGEWVDDEQAWAPPEPLAQPVGTTTYGEGYNPDTGTFAPPEESYQAEPVYTPPQPVDQSYAANPVYEPWSPPPPYVDASGPEAEQMPGPAPAPPSSVSSPAAAPTAPAPVPATPATPTAPTGTFRDRSGNIVRGLTPQQIQQFQAEDQRQAMREEEARRLQEKNERDRIDILRATQAATEAFNKAMQETRNREVALQAARDAMEAELRRQDLALREKMQGTELGSREKLANQQAEQAKAELAQRTQQAAATVSIEREKLDAQRRQRRGRRRAQVRYR